MRDDVELVRPQSPDADPAAAAAQLNEERQRLLDEAMALAAERRLVESARHEYGTVHGLTPTDPEPSWVAEVRHHSGAIGGALGANPPIYDTPIQNMHPAEAAMVDIKFLEAEERQQRIC